jgi:hypothetical protein
MPAWCILANQLQPKVLTEPTVGLKRRGIANWWGGNDFEDRDRGTVTDRGKQAASNLLVGHGSISLYGEEEIMGEQIVEGYTNTVINVPSC